MLLTHLHNTGVCTHIKAETKCLKHAVCLKTHTRPKNIPDSTTHLDIHTGIVYNTLELTQRFKSTLYGFLNIIA